MLLGGNAEFEKLRSEIAIRLAGLFYYLGLMLRHDHWAERNDRLPAVFVAATAVGFCTGCPRRCTEARCHQ